MEIFTRRLRVKDKFSIVVISDVHAGGNACDKKLLKSVIKYIASKPNCFWISLGDLWEAILPSDKRFDKEMFDWEFYNSKDPNRYFSDWGEMFIETMHDWFKPIAHKCLGMSIGNHEWNAEEKRLLAISERLCQKLGTKFLGWTWHCRLIINDNKILVIQGEHGYSAPRTAGALLNNMVTRIGKKSAVDILLWGHAHQGIIHPVPDTGASRNIKKEDDEKYDAKLRWVIACPSMVNAYMLHRVTYAERKQYDATLKGAIEIFIDPSSKKGISVKPEMIFPEPI